MTLASVATVKMEPCVEKNIVMVGQHTGNTQESPNEQENKQMCANWGMGQGGEDKACKSSTCPPGGLRWKIFPGESSVSSLYVQVALPSNLLKMKQNIDILP